MLPFYWTFYIKYTALCQLIKAAWTFNMDPYSKKSSAERLFSALLVFCSLIDRTFQLGRGPAAEKGSQRGRSVGGEVWSACTINDGHWINIHIDTTAVLLPPINASSLIAEPSFRGQTHFHYHFCFQSIETIWCAVGLWYWGVCSHQYSIVLIRKS